MGVRYFLIITLLSVLFVSFYDTLRHVCSDDDLLELVQKIENEEESTELKEEEAKVLHTLPYWMWVECSALHIPLLTYVTYYYQEPHLAITIQPPAL